MPEVWLVGDAGLPDGGPDNLADWLGRPLPDNLHCRIPGRWHRPPLAGLLFRRSLRALRRQDAVLLCRDPRVACAERGRWKQVILEWHIRPQAGEPQHRNAFEAADLHVAVAAGIARDLEQGGVPADQILGLPNACGVAVDRACRRHREARGKAVEGGFVLAMGLHRRGGLDLALEAWREDPALPQLLVAGRDQGGERVEAWQRAIDADPRLRGRVRLVGPRWGVTREDLLDGELLWLCLYPRDEDSIEHLSPLQVADAAGSGLPLVATDLPSVRRLLDGSPAVLVVPEDPVALAAGVRQGLDSGAPDPLQRFRWRDRAQYLLERK
ncbi:MAG: glycosyltransferase [Myxococcota bacterium]|nr:glycosyltransferase [Myxococcota bacterium]